MLNIVRFCGRLSKITEDAFFAEPVGGFPKGFNFLESSRFAELVGWPKIVDKVAFLSKVTKMSEVFRRSQKIAGTSK